jgi:hypothetical protein
VKENNHQLAFRLLWVPLALLLLLHQAFGKAGGAEHQCQDAVGRSVTRRSTAGALLTAAHLTLAQCDISGRRPLSASS